LPLVRDGKIILTNTSKHHGVISAQRLAAQPLGHIRYLVTILAGILKPYSNVLSLSLGQVGCSRVLGCIYFNS
jgi:hypothetical protein